MKTNNPTGNKPGITNIPGDVRVISFDVGFTLIYTDPPVGEVYAEIAARFGYHLSGAEIHSRFKKTWKKVTTLNRQKKANNAQAEEKRSYEWWKEIFKESIGDIFSGGDLEKVFKVCYDEYAGGKYWKLYPEVRSTLDALKAKGYRLVVLSNWDQRLTRTLQELQLARYFEEIYISTQIGFAKPDPGAFLYILDDLKIPARTLLHVGDTLEEDIRGARQAGVRAFYLDRPGKNQAASLDVPVISSLSELLT
ncbi:MAG: HAD-IA family hydrolase [Candidatus Aminicenantes bacterium]|nr:HAD-IA family hydrolase [Candidatus Aminicenantes bacterium]